jgi:hypothetical protein
MEEEPEEYTNALWRVILLLALATAVAVIAASCSAVMVEYDEDGTTRAYLLPPAVPWPPAKVPPRNSLMPQTVPVAVQWIQFKSADDDLLSLDPGEVRKP